MLPPLIQRLAPCSSSERGVTMPLVALSLVAILSFAGSSIDLGALYEAKQKPSVRPTPRPWPRRKSSQPKRYHRSTNGSGIGASSAEVPAVYASLAARIIANQT